SGKPTSDRTTATGLRPAMKAHGPKRPLRRLRTARRSASRSSSRRKPAGSSAIWDRPSRARSVPVGAAIAGLGATPAGAAAGRRPVLAIRCTTLDSGVTVVTEAMPDVRSVTLGFWVATGSRDEDPSFAGASHFLEHLLFKGTDTRSAQDIAEAIDAVGGDINAFTTKEYTAFYVRVLSDSLDLGLDILSDIMWSPAFRPDEV